METNTVKKKEINKQIKQNEKLLKIANDYLATSEKAVNQESARLSKQGYSTTLLKGYVDTAKKANDYSLPVEDTAISKAELVDLDIQYPDFELLGTYVKEYMSSQNEILTYETTIKKLNDEITKIDKNDNDGKQTTQQDIPHVDGHLYPVALVVNCTNKLNYWNSLLDKYIEKIDQTDTNVNITWLVKKIEWLCRKINYGLAMLRYYIVKSMGAIYKKVQDNIPVLKVITDINVLDLPSVISLGKAVVNFFTKPYKALVDFIVDFATYTPPLVGSAASLVGKTAIVPVKWLGTINFVAEDKENGEQKQLVEVYKQYINLKMDSIKLTDLQNSSGASKPAIAEFSGNAQQYERLSTESDIIDSQVERAWTDFVSEVQTTWNNSGNVLPMLRCRYVEKINWINEGRCQYYIEAGRNKEMSTEEIAPIVYEQTKLQSKAEKAKQEAINKAQVAQEKAERARKASEKRDQAAASHILDDQLVAEAEQAKAEAEQAKIEADKALEEANNIDTTANIPWGTLFNSAKYPVYAYITTESLPMELNNGMQYLSNLKDNLISYYDAMYGVNVSGRTTKKLQPYVDFLRTFIPAYPCIEELLATLMDCANGKKHVVDEMNRLNRVSIFK